MPTQTFDPVAAHFDNNVGADDSPFLTLEVEGLTSGQGDRHESLELQPDDGAGEDESAPDTPVPPTTPGADELDVYGWESSLWSRIRGYLGF